MRRKLVFSIAQNYKEMKPIWSNSTFHFIVKYIFTFHIFDINKKSFYEAMILKFSRATWSFRSVSSHTFIHSSAWKFSIELSFIFFKSWSRGLNWFWCSALKASSPFNSLLKLAFCYKLCKAVWLLGEFCFATFV